MGRKREQWRRLTIESLEMRTLLAAGLTDQTVLDTSLDTASKAGAAINLRLVPVAAPSSADRADSLPTALTTITGIRETFCVEVWARNGDTSSHGIVGGYLDVMYTAGLADATDVEAGSLYAEMARATIDNPGGRIDDLGGLASPGVVDLGTTQWVRLACVEFRTTATGTVSFTADPGVDRLARAGEGTVEWSSVDLASAGASLTVLPGDPSTPGLFDPQTCTFYLRDSNTIGIADWTFGYGDPQQSWTPLVGDWNGDQGETVGFLDPKSCTWYLSDSLEGGYATHTFACGDPRKDWTPLVGDWDGDGVDTIGFFAAESCSWYLRNQLSTGYADCTLGYGDSRQSWTPLVGDWDGDGIDTIGFYDPATATWYLRNALSTGFADWTFGYGDPQQKWQPIVGDWNGDGRDSIGFYDPANSLFYLRNSLSAGYADTLFGYGAGGAGWQVLIGQWEAPAKVDFPAATGDELPASKWLDFDAADTVGASATPEVTLENTADGLAGHVSVPGAWIETTTIGDRSAARLSIPETASTDTVGQPELPVIRTLVSIPAGTGLVPQVTFEEQTVTLEEAGTDLPLAPLQEPVAKLPGALERVRMAINRWAYAANQYSPAEAVRVVPAGQQGGNQMLLVEVMPVAYNPVTHTLKIRSEIDFQLTRVVATQALQTEFAASSSKAGESAAATKASAGRLLVVCDASLSGGLDPFVEFKTGEGWTVDTLIPSSSTTASIRNSIIARYANTATRPDAVLLVGDTSLIPCFIGVGEDHPSTDLYYACMDGGDDWYPDVAIGRFSVQNTTELSNLIEKTIAYQTSAGSWTKHAVFMAGEDNYEITEATHNDVVSQYLDPRGYTSTKLYATTYGATGDAVSAAFNHGQVLGIYSGHGSETSWADGPAFRQSDVDSLTNAGMYPFVASFACLTGDYAVDECFAETWLRGADRGAIDVWASSTYSYWNEDDTLERCLFSAIYDDSQVSFGAATLRAKELYLEHYGNVATTRRYFEMYNLLGDPTTTLTGLDLTITTDREAPFAYRNDAYSLTLQAASGTEPYRWSITGGQLPAGLTLDADTGVISGTPTELSDTWFTVTVTDAASHTDSLQIHLPVLDRLTIASAADLKIASLDEYFSCTLLATGGTTPYTWTATDLGTYQETTSTSTYAGGGVAQGWQDDDAAWSLDLPFAFPYYGKSYQAVYVSSNGYLDFASSASQALNSDSRLASSVRIAALWDDLRTDMATGEDVYISESSNQVTIRWKAETYNTGHLVDFAVVLHSDGTIDFKYGTIDAGLTPTIGISSGDGANYALSVRNGASRIAANAVSTFAYTSPLPAGLSLSSDGKLTGIPTEVGDYTFNIQVQDSGTRQQTVSRAFQLAVRDLSQLQVTLPASTTEGSGTLTGAGRVSIANAETANLNVYLAWSTGSEVSSPTMVTIPAGQLSTTFNLTVTNDTYFDGTQTAQLTARAMDFSDGVAAIAVHDNETTTIAVDLPPATQEGTATVTGTIQLGHVAGRDVLVRLDSSDPSEIVVPSYVAVPIGSSSATFNLIVADDAVIDGEQTALVTATVQNWTAGSDTIAVDDNDNTIAVTLPDEAWEGAGLLSTCGLVKLGGMAPADVTVTLTASVPGELSVPADVVIRAGQMSASFDLNVLNDTARDGARNVTIAASASGFSSGGDTMLIRDNDPAQFAFSAIDDQLGGEPFDVTITALDVNDALISVYDGPLALSATGNSGPLEARPTNAAGVVLDDGRWTGTVVVNALDIDVRLKVANDEASGESDVFDVTYGSMHHFAFSAIDSPQAANQPFAITVSARDAHGFLVSNYSGQAELSCHTAAPYVTLGGGATTDDFLLDCSLSDCRTQCIYWPEEIGGPRTISGLGIEVATAPGKTLTDFTIRLKHNPADTYSTPAWESAGWTTVFHNQTTIDTTGWMSFAFDTPFQYNGVDNLLVDISFSNNTASECGLVRVTDTGAVRTVSNATTTQYGEPLNWSGTTNPPPIASTKVPNLRLTVSHVIDVTPATTGTFANGLWSGTVALAESGRGLVLQADDGSAHSGMSGLFSVSGSKYDLDGNGWIGTGDFALFSPAWQTKPGDANWNRAADFNNDNLVDQADFDLLKQNWFKAVSEITTTDSEASKTAQSGSAADDSQWLAAVAAEVNRTTADENDLDLLALSASTKPSDAIDAALLKIT
jgi:hypothetical protein